MATPFVVINNLKSQEILKALWKDLKTLGYTTPNGRYSLDKDELYENGLCVNTGKPKTVDQMSSLVAIICTDKHYRLFYLPQDYEKILEFAKEQLDLVKNRFYNKGTLLSSDTHFYFVTDSNGACERLTNNHSGLGNLLNVENIPNKESLKVVEINDNFSIITKFGEVEFNLKYKDLSCVTKYGIIEKQALINAINWITSPPKLCNYEFRSYINNTAYEIQKYDIGFGCQSGTLDQLKNILEYWNLLKRIKQLNEQYNGINK